MEKQPNIYDLFRILADGNETIMSGIDIIEGGALPPKDASSLKTFGLQCVQPSRRDGDCRRIPCGHAELVNSFGIAWLNQTRLKPNGWHSRLSGGGIKPVCFQCLITDHLRHRRASGKHLITHILIT